MNSVAYYQLCDVKMGQVFLGLKNDKKICFVLKSAVLP